MYTLEDLKSKDLKEITKENMFDELLTLRKKLFISKSHTISTQISSEFEKPVRTMSDYHQVISKFPKLRDPFAEERKVVKETLPFGNPFKYITRQPNQSNTFSITDEDVLLNTAAQSNPQYGVKSINSTYPSILSRESKDKETIKKYPFGLENLYEKESSKKMKYSLKKKKDYEEKQESSSRGETEFDILNMSETTRSKSVSPGKEEINTKKIIKEYFEKNEFFNLKESNDAFLISQAESNQYIIIII